jgi:DNA-binding MarR family transcriptional regulator
MTPTQQQIILFLNTRPNAIPKDASDAIGKDRKTCYMALLELMEQEFVYREKTSNGAHAYSLTDDGKSVARRIDRYAAYEGQIVQPNRTNRMAGFYEPSTGYQRNNGRDLRIGVSV